MNKKNILIAFVVVMVLAVFGIAELLVLEKQRAPVSVVTAPLPQPTLSLQPTPIPQVPPQEQCNISRGHISTSTWKTFSSPNWEITFQYPSNWRIEQGGVVGGRSYLNILGDGDALNIKRDEDGRGLYEGFNYKSCNRTIAGQNVIFFECEAQGYYICHPGDTSSIAHLYSQPLYSQTHHYNIFASGPSSTEITAAVLDTFKFTVK